MDVRIAVPEEHVTAPILNAGLEMNTRLNEKLIGEGSAPTFAAAVKRGVRWQAEPPGAERFDHARKVMARGWGDCDDLAPMHAASLRVTGEDPQAKAIVFKSGPHRWHAVVQRGDGSIEDPSQTAGMRVRPGSRAEGIPAAVVGCMHTGRGVGGSVRPFVAVRRDGVGWAARADLPWVGCEHGVSTYERATTPALALSGAIRGACIVGDVSEMCDDEHVKKMWALQGLLQGQRPRALAAVVGAEATKEAIRSLADMAPHILHELQEHRRAVEKGYRVAGSPFDSFNYRGAFNRAHGVRDEVGSFFGDIAKGIKSVAKEVSKVTKVVAPILSAVQGVVSLIPGIGTGISAAIGAGLAILSGGGLLDIAVHTAYGAIPIPAGVRNLTDIALDAAMSLIHTHDLGEAVLAGIKAKIPKGIPQQVFDTLAHIIIQAVHKKPTHAVVTHPPTHTGAPSTIKALPPVHAPHIAPPLHPSTSTGARVAVRAASKVSAKAKPLVMMPVAQASGHFVIGHHILLRHP